jgi:hypothetical protein
VTRLGRRWLRVCVLLLLGHSLGLGYLELKAKRAEAHGMYVSALQSYEGYATIDWDDFVYYPRAIAVAEGWWPIDPWIDHEQRMPTWGIIPPLPATIFGLLLRGTGDIHTALYLASIVSTVLIGLMLAMLLEGDPFRLSPLAALLAAIVFVKMPWLAVKAQQLVPPWGLVRETINPFVLGRPLDALTTVEAGLFTYAFYTLFIVLFWRAVYRRQLSTFVAAGAAAGLLIYVYFYHYIFAFALLACWLVIALVRREWREARLAAHAVVTGLVCTIPHFVNILRTARYLDVPAYVSRLGVEPGRFVFGNLKYLAALAIPLAVGVVYARKATNPDRRAVALRLLEAMVLAYFGVLNLRLVLGFDVQSDHYWRQSLALPATLWVIVACTELARDRSRAPRLGLLIVIVTGIVASNASWLMGRTHPETPSAAQLEMAERMDLVIQLARPGDVVMVTDVATAYHASVNARVRPFVPFVHALVGERDILTRFFTAQYFTGIEPFRMPARTNLPTVDETAALRSEQKYLLGTDEPQPADRLLDIRQAVSSAFQRGDAPLQPRVDLILVPSAQQSLAHMRIVKHFDIVEEGSGGGYWAARVKPKVKPT